MASCFGSSEIFRQFLFMPFILPTPLLIVPSLISPYLPHLSVPFLSFCDYTDSVLLAPFCGEEI